VTEDLFWQAAGPLICDDEPSAVLLAGMTVLAADGMLVNVADTPTNRAMPGAIPGSSRAGEQTLLKRLARRPAGCPTDTG